VGTVMKAVNSAVNISNSRRWAAGAAGLKRGTTGLDAMLAPPFGSFMIECALCRPRRWLAVDLWNQPVAYLDRDATIADPALS